MNTNLFEEFQQKKAKVRNLAEAALQKGWLSRENYTEIVNKLDTDILTIGVIGQMKCGKSTFLKYLDKIAGKLAPTGVAAINAGGYFLLFASQFPKFAYSYTNSLKRHD